uniref:Small ribosomal subunit protein uS8c n=2 Tax=Bryopsidineae TaxID=2791029 RepID=A0A0D6E1A4_BRYPL|nr:30S ribosomal protein S8 [Bryopsis plumosa]AJF21958.1 ribosomal protein S8 [Codium decorticatum]CEO90984.1 30S ribosomal protein S8 [Bryopsis plumosa]
MDLISNVLTYIRNGNLSKNKSVRLPYLKTTIQLVKILKNEGFIDSFVITKKEESIEQVYTDHIIVFLKYEGRNRKPILTNLKRISKPGRRIYVNSKQVPQLLGGLGILILSTSQGILTNKQARNLKIGGELLCSIW